MGQSLSQSPFISNIKPTHSHIISILLLLLLYNNSEDKHTNTFSQNDAKVRCVYVINASNYTMSSSKS